MKRFYLVIACIAAASCSLLSPDSPDYTKTSVFEDSNLQRLARMFAELPLETEHLKEVHDAVEASSGQGYDEEYTMDCILAEPGSGVGSSKALTKAAGYTNPLRNLIREYYDSHPATRASTDEMMDRLAASGYQVYWPYSENWDGETFPLITFDPGYGAESNYGYYVSLLEDGTRKIDSVYVDERVAMKRPVWVLNSNSDSGFSPVDLFSTMLPTRSAKGEIQPSPACTDSSQSRSSAALSTTRYRKLMMKSFKMLRHYDSWFRGASEFICKIGSVEGFNASTEAELKLYSPSVTDFVIVVQRKYLGKELPFESLLVSDFSEQLDKLAFLVTEDDGGTRTNWRCQASVKIQSKTYGFDIDIPYNEKDDIVWRGQLSKQFFEEQDLVSGRFGDVIITFELE